MRTSVDVNRLDGVMGHYGICRQLLVSGEHQNERLRVIISVSSMPAAARAQYQLGFFSGGYTGTAGTKPFRFGITTFGSVFSSMTSFSLTMPFQ
jgi:hypothetical protein